MIVAGEIRKALGGRIRVARKTRLNNMPLEEFGRQVAKLMGRARAFSNVTVSNWETGRQEPSWEALVSIARLTHLPLRYFAGVGDVESYPLASWMESKPNGLDARLRTLASAVQRLDARQQRLVVKQMENMLDVLGEDSGAGVAGSSRADRS